MRFAKDEGEVRLQQVNLRFDSTAWASTRESVVSWQGGGLEIDSLELRSRDGAGARSDLRERRAAG